LNAVVNQSGSYQEMHQVYSALAADCNHLLQFFSSCNIDISGYYQTNQQTGEYTLPVSMEMADHLTNAVYEMCANLVRENVPVITELDARRKRAQLATDTYRSTSLSLATNVSNALCCAIVKSEIPQDVKHLNTVVNHLLENVQDGTSATLQRRAAVSIVFIFILFF
jgi:hypothetical protein